MKKRILILIVTMLLALVFSIALVACNDGNDNTPSDEQSAPTPIVPEPDKEYEVEVLNLLPDSRDIWWYGDDLQKGKTTVRAYFVVPFTGEYLAGFTVRSSNTYYEGAKLTGASLNGVALDLSNGYKNIPMKLNSGSDNVLEIELYSEDEYGNYAFSFKVREGFEDMTLLPGEESIYAIDPKIIGNGVKRFYSNSEDGIELISASWIDFDGNKSHISLNSGKSDKSRLDVPIAVQKKVYISVKNVSDKAAQVRITEGSFDVLSAPGESIEVTYTGNESSDYLIKVKFSKSNMRIRIRKKGETELYSGVVWISSTMLNAATGEYAGTVYGLQRGEYQLIGAENREFYVNFTVEEAGTFIFELSEIG